MVINKNIYYINEDKWEEFLNKYKEYGYVQEGGFAYPDYVRKLVGDYTVRIYISEPCENVWDHEDKNHQREVWIWNGCNGYGSRARVAPYIQDLIESGYVN